MLFRISSHKLHPPVHPQTEQYKSLSAFDLDWKSLTALIQVGEIILPENTGTFKINVFIILAKYSYNTAHPPHLFYGCAYQNRKPYKYFYLRDQVWDRNIQKRILLHLPNDQA